MQHKLALALVEQAGAGRDEGWFSPRDMETRSETLTVWADARHYHIIRLQEPHPAVTRFVNAGQAKLCYAFRDIRDVAVLARRGFGYRGDALLERLQRAVDIYYVIHTFDGVLSQQYEELVGAIDEATDQMVDFLGLDTPTDVRERIAEWIRLEFAAETHRAPPRRAGRGWFAGLFGAPGHARDDANDTGWDLGVGGRRDLPADEAWRIEMRFGAWLRDAGYEGTV